MSRHPRPRLRLAREAILAFRRAAGSLDARLPAGPASLRQAAVAGLQDSMPRAAVLSIHARAAGTPPNAWEDPAFAQVWGPRFQVYVVAAEDAPLFTVARYPDDARGRRVAEDMAGRAADVLGDRRLPDREVAGPLGIGNAIRYGTTTGVFRIRWEGARAPLLWVVPRPTIEPFDARLELARRYLHAFGPTTADSFAKWAGVGARQAVKTFEALAPELVEVDTPIGPAAILASDEPLVGALASGPLETPADARFLPSGDTFFLLWGRDRELLVPDPARRDELWTSRVWPGALLVGGDLAGTWRRAGPNLSIQPWRSFTRAERTAIEDEAASLPLPDLGGRIRVTWDG